MRQINVTPPSEVHARFHGTGVQQTSTTLVKNVPERSRIADTENVSTGGTVLPPVARSCLAEVRDELPLMPGQLVLTGVFGRDSGPIRPPIRRPN